MITTSTHQPTANERMAEYMGKKVHVQHLNLPPQNIFTKQFNQDFDKEFSNDRV